MTKLIDKSGNELTIGDIIKAENLETKELFYYLYGKNMLYKYNKQGEIEEESYNNIKVDDGLSLVNNNVWVWTRLGRKEEVYSKIFR